MEKRSGPFDVMEKQWKKNGFDMRNGNGGKNRERVK